MQVFSKVLSKIGGLFVGQGIHVSQFRNLAMS